MLLILFYSFVLTLYVTKGEEPHCSKFDFEEKVLEKMVRIEFEMERLKLEMQKSVETVQKMNTQVESNVDIFSKKQEVIDGQIEKLEDFKNKLREEVKHELQTELASFKGTGIGFSVYSPVSGTGGSSSSALKFSQVVENSVGAFNMTTGEFVCRQSGLYFFSTTVIRSTAITQAAYCFFYKDDTKNSYVAGYASDEDAVYTSGTNSIMYHLRPGDTASLRSCENSNHFDPSTSFTGFIVHADN